MILEKPYILRTILGRGFSFGVGVYEVGKSIDYLGFTPKYAGHIIDAQMNIVNATLPIFGSTPDDCMKDGLKQLELWLKEQAQKVNHLVNNYEASKVDDYAR